MTRSGRQDETRGVPRTGFAVGVDVGGTTTSAVLLGPDRTVLARVQARTPAADGGRAVVTCVADLVRRVDPGAQADVLGVGATGVVDVEDGRVAAATSAMPGWVGTVLPDRLRECLPERRWRDVGALNDVHAFVLAEAWLGAGGGVSEVLGVTVGTGVGGGFLASGRLVRGARGVAGHLGHVPVPAASGRRCPCGALGHVEAVSAAPAMLAEYRLLAGAGGEHVPDLAAVGRRAVDGDVLGREVLAHGGRALGEALAGVVAVCDPAVVVIGGGVLDAGALFLEPLQDALRAHAHPVVATVPVRRAALGQDAVGVGAALHVLTGAT
ncbi:ROK family protein [Jannaschia sp. R86511]|uniref:ROK family protein n=1 Tax=Jannaschia sp. R86511 TaxID=3093853 RepID=UPI0036D21CFA